MSTISINGLFCHLTQSYIYKSTLKTHKQVQKFRKIFQRPKPSPSEMMHEFFELLGLYRACEKILSEVLWTY